MTTGSLLGSLVTSCFAWFTNKSVCWLWTVGEMRLSTFTIKWKLIFTNRRKRCRTAVFSRFIRLFAAMPSRRLLYLLVTICYSAALRGVYSPEHKQKWCNKCGVQDCPSSAPQSASGPVKCTSRTPGRCRAGSGPGSSPSPDLWGTRKHKYLHQKR